MNEYLPGFIAGTTRTAISYPFDVIKVHMQKNQSGNIFSNIYNILKKNTKVLYRGSITNFFIYPIDRSIQYKLLEKYRNDYNNYLLGFSIGSLSSVYMTPIQYITRNAVLIDHKNYKNIFSFIKSISIKKMYSVFPLEYLKVSLGACIYMGTYSTLREKIHKDYQVFFSPILGGISSIINWSIIFPIDSIITNYVYNTHHKKNTNILSIIKEKYSIKGLRGFYFGITPIFIRTLPTSMTSMLTYEMTRNIFNN